MDTLSRRLVVLGVALTTVVSTLVAQTPPVKDMAELVATLKDASLTLGRKQGLVRQMYAGVVEVLEVHEVPRVPPADRPYDSLGLTKPSMRILVDVGASNPDRLFLAFESADVDRAARVRKGDRLHLTGKLVKLVRHKEGYDGRPDEWLVFDQVMIGGR